MLRVFDATGSTVQIATWNVNSVRTRLDQVLSWLDKEQPDLLCLQETKVDDPCFPLKTSKLLAGMHIHGQKAYNGVALISREPLEDVRCGFLGNSLMTPKRRISANRSASSAHCWMASAWSTSTYPMDRA